jgi:hypothetical protein
MLTSACVGQAEREMRRQVEPRETPNRFKNVETFPEFRFDDFHVQSGRTYAEKIPDVE